jgi:hypothetical protein
MVARGGRWQRRLELMERMHDHIVAGAGLERRLGRAAAHGCRAPPL